MCNNTFTEYSNFLYLVKNKHVTMKKLLVLVLAMTATLISCDKNTPEYSIEGKWIWSPSLDRADANTMYEFVDGSIYKSYCVTCPADDDYWNSLDSTDRIPGVDSYTFDGDTLIWNGTPIGITFECEGGNLMYNGQFAQKWRLSSDCQ